MSKKPSILFVGLPINTASDEGKQIEKDVNTAVEKLRSEGYLDFEHICLEDDGDYSSIIRRLRESHLDAFVIGGGFKFLPNHNTGFEALVNIVKDTSPHTRLLFVNRSPLEVLDAVKRFEEHRQGSE